MHALAPRASSSKREVICVKFWGIHKIANAYCTLGTHTNCAIFISPKGKSWLLLWFAKALAYAISV